MRTPGDGTAYQLRPVHPGDAPAVLQAFESAPDMARQGEVVDLASAQQYVEWLQARGRRASAVTKAKRLVGLVAISVDEVNRSGWVFYWMHAGHRGRGVIGRALATVADDMLETDLERLELGHRVNNPASGQVAVSAGFVQEGCERAKFLIDGERIDVLTYGRLRTDAWPQVEHLSACAIRR